MGRKKTPTRKLELRGSWVAKTRTEEPKGTDGIVMPKYLIGEAAKKWKEETPSLIEMGVLKKQDIDAFAQYCVLFAKWKNKVLLDLPYGMDPETRALLTEMDKLRIEFGLTPSSRAGLKIEKPQKDEKGFYKAG